jgi:hypothetical protein
MLHAFEVKSSDDQAQSGGSVRVVGYGYSVIDTGGRELLAFHWHPDGQSPIVEPHLHIHGAVAGIALDSAHVPTGLVSLQSFLRFLIRDFAVVPLRPDWPTLLEESP